MRFLWAALLGVLLCGCGPKRVVRSDPADVVSPDQGTPTPETREDISRDNPDGEPDSGLPDPGYRGGAGMSSLEQSETVAQEPLTGSRLGLEAAALAKQQLGKPYQWGAEGPDKFDCSGLVMYVYNRLGVKLPRVSGLQAYSGVHVDYRDLQPGDLVFFKLNGSTIDHVGIYVGRSKFVHAPSKYQPVKTESLNNSYWRGRFKGGRRLG